MKEGTTSELWMRQCCADIRILFGFVKTLMCHMEHLVDIVSMTNFAYLFRVYLQKSIYFLSDLS